MIRDIDRKTAGDASLPSATSLPWRVAPAISSGVRSGRRCARCTPPRWNASAGGPHHRPGARAHLRRQGYRGHDYDQPLRVFRAGQKRGLTPCIKRRLRRRSAIEPVIGHMKEDGRLGRNVLSNRHGDRLNAILCGVGQRPPTPQVVRAAFAFLPGLNAAYSDGTAPFEPQPSANPYLTDNSASCGGFVTAR